MRDVSWIRVRIGFLEKKNRCRQGYMVDDGGIVDGWILIVLHDWIYPLLTKYMFYSQYINI